MIRDSRNRPFEEWTREVLADDLGSIGWTLTDYAAGTYRPARAFAAHKDIPGIGGKRITAPDARTLYVRCEAYDATRLAVPPPPAVRVVGGPQSRP